MPKRPRQAEGGQPAASPRQMPDTKPNRFRKTLFHGAGDMVSACVEHFDDVEASDVLLGCVDLTGVKDANPDSLESGERLPRAQTDRLINLVFGHRDGRTLRASHCKQVLARGRDGSWSAVPCESPGRLLFCAACALKTEPGCGRVVCQQTLREDGSLRVLLRVRLPLHGPRKPDRALVMFMLSWMAAVRGGKVPEIPNSLVSSVAADHDSAACAAEAAFEARLRASKPADLAEMKARLVAELGLPLPPYDHQIVAAQMMVEKEAEPPLLGACDAVVPGLWFDPFAGTVHGGKDEPLAAFRGGTLTLPTGAGKTFTAILLALTQRTPPKQLARPLAFRGTVFVVPDHLAGQWRRELARFAPRAVLATSATAPDLESLDMLVMTHADAQRLERPLHVLRVVVDGAHAVDPSATWPSKLTAAYTWAMAAPFRADGVAPRSYKAQLAALGLGEPHAIAAARWDETEKRATTTKQRFQRLMISAGRVALERMLPRVESSIAIVKRSAADSEACARLEKHDSRVWVDSGEFANMRLRQWESWQGTYHMPDWAQIAGICKHRKEAVTLALIARLQEGYVDGVRPLASMATFVPRAPVSASPPRGAAAPSPLAGQPAARGAGAAPAVAPLHARWLESVLDDGSRHFTLLDDEEDERAGGDCPPNQAGPQQRADAPATASAECPVCLNVMANDGVVLHARESDAQAQHVVCHACLVGLPQPRACPLCRKPVELESLRRVVLDEAALDAERRDAREAADAAWKRPLLFTSKIAEAVRLVAANARKSLVFVNNARCANAAICAMHGGGQACVLMAKVGLSLREKVLLVKAFVEVATIRCMIMPTLDSHPLCEGLDLTVADQIVFINTSKKAHVEQQALSLCVRVGQPSPVVRVVHLQVPNEYAATDMQF